MNKTSNYYFPLNDKNLLCHTVKSSGQVGDRTHNGPLRGLWCYPQHHFFATSARITPHGVHLYRNSPAFPTGVFIFEMSIHPSHSLCHMPYSQSNKPSYRRPLGPSANYCQENAFPHLCNVDKILGQFLINAI